MGAMMVANSACAFDFVISEIRPSFLTGDAHIPSTAQSTIPPSSSGCLSDTAYA
jgi:hypothetical protein